MGRMVGRKMAIANNSNSLGANGRRRDARATVFFSLSQVAKQLLGAGGTPALQFSFPQVKIQKSKVKCPMPHAQCPMPHAHFTK